MAVELERAAFDIFDVPCTVTPLGGVPYTSKVTPHPTPKDEGLLEGPLFSFWNAEAPGLGQGTIFTIAEGARAGTWRVVRKHRDDGRVTKVVATRG